MVVRPGNCYGPGRPGQLVQIDAREAESPTTRSTLMTLDEAKALGDKIDAARKEAEEKVSKPGRIAAMVTDAMAVAEKAVLKKASDAAAARADGEAMESDEKQREAAMLAKLSAPKPAKKKAG